MIKLRLSWTQKIVALSSSSNGKLVPFNERGFVSSFSKCLLKAYFCHNSSFGFMIKSIIIELSTPATDELLALLKDSRKLLEEGGTIEIVSPTKMHIISLEKSGQSEEQALVDSPIGKMLRTAGFKGNVSITRRGHLGGESTHIIAAV